ncbi:hypothetical protein V6N13_069481 [Hibiscus sabdariffa]
MRRDIADRSELSIAEQANCMKVGRHAMDLNFEGFVFKVVSTIGGTSISCHRCRGRILCSIRRQTNTHFLSYLSILEPWILSLA